ncbi:hypothetical protein D3C80_1715120 [compost metagenome]
MRPASAEYSVVSDIHGLGDDHFVPRSKQALADGIQRTLCASEHHHLLDTDLRATTACNRLAQRKVATHITVVGVAAAKAEDRSFDNGRWRIEVRIAHRQQEDFAPFATQGLCLVVDIPGSSAITGNALGERGIAHDCLPVCPTRTAGLKTLCAE